MIRFGWLHRHRTLDDRVTEARQRAEDAAGEVLVSRARARTVRETVVNPLRRRGDQNEFAELLRESLTDGYRR